MYVYVCPYIRIDSKITILNYNPVMMYSHACARLEGMLLHKFPFKFLKYIET